jgi:hypothetical protein
MHFPVKRAFGTLIFVVISSLLAPASLVAADHFLAIGGGDSPTNNQISLEKNVLFFQRVLCDCQGPTTVPDVLFSDGTAGTRDLQFDPSEDPPRLNVLLARLFGREGDLYHHYRKHQITGLTGPSTRAGLDAWFNGEGKKLAEGDRLIIYFTGHGGGGKPAANTTISMWCERPMHVNEFAGLLDRLSPKVQVVLVMVQCHSGGFANAIFKDGKPGNELSPARRCGFFATTFDRLAAGCTSDTTEDDYKDYSTYFFAALDGKTRAGKPVSGCDLDGDGRVSFAEAHAYTLIHSDTIDIPTTTSDAFLRQFSKTSGKWPGRGPTISYPTLLAGASVVQKAALEGLSEQLKLTSDDRAPEVQHLAELVEAERKTVERDQKRKSDEADRVSQNIRFRVLQRWPELSNPYSPVSQELMKQEGTSIQEAIEKDSDTAKWELLRRDADKLDDREMDLQRRWVKCQRMIRLLETVTLAINLEKVATPGTIERYKQLMEDEAGVLSPKAAGGQ